MYNQPMKAAFIEMLFKDLTLSATMVNSIFKKTTMPFEVEYDKDVAYFSEDEIIHMLRAKGSRSLESLQNTVVILRKYADFVFAHENAYALNNYEFINKDILMGCLSDKAQKTILSRQDIDQIKAEMLNAVDKAILECLFIGISGKNLEDLTYLCEEQLDYSECQLRLKSGKVVSLTYEQCALLEAAFHETTSISYSGNHQETPVSGYGCLYKEKPNALPGDSPDKRYRWVLRRVVIWRDYFNLDVLTMKSISTSGLVHELKIALSKYDKMDLRSFLSSEEGLCLARQYGYGTNIHYVEVIYNKVKKYL